MVEDRLVDIDMRMKEKSSLPGISNSNSIECYRNGKELFKCFLDF